MPQLSTHPRDLTLHRQPSSNSPYLVNLIPMLIHLAGYFTPTTAYDSQSGFMAMEMTLKQNIVAAITDLKIRPMMNSSSRKKVLMMIINNRCKVVTPNLPVASFSIFDSTWRTGVIGEALELSVTAIFPIMVDKMISSTREEQNCNTCASLLVMRCGTIQL